MNDFVAFSWIVAGVLLSVAVPIAVKTLRPKTSTESHGDGWFKTTVWPYLKYTLASLVIGFLALVIFKYGGGSFAAWPQALMTGYLWDSTFQKFKQGLEG